MKYYTVRCPLGGSLELWSEQFSKPNIWLFRIQKFLNQEDIDLCGLGMILGSDLIVGNPIQSPQAFRYLPLALPHCNLTEFWVIPSTNKPSTFGGTVCTVKDAGFSVSYSEFWPRENTLKSYIFPTPKPSARNQVFWTSLFRQFDEVTVLNWTR